MMSARVAVIRTRPETVIEDIDRLVEMAGIEDALPVSKTTILKDNISWHMPFLSANTTPWQLEGVIKALRKREYGDVVCVENRTVVTDPVKGRRLNRYNPVLSDNSIPVKSNFDPGHMRWIKYEPKAEMLVLDKIYPKGVYLPDYFFGKNIVHLPTM
ncbi:MAG: DUF362 domain-containing protein, partial [Planctomycetota bacterium]